MKNYRYIIIGGGMTGSSAAMGIRKNDQDGAIAMFSEEKFGPYNRPALSKGLWEGKEIKDFVRPMDEYDVDLFLETEVVKIIPDKKIIITANGEQFKYQKLLLATGGRPIQLPDCPEGVIFYRTRADYHKLNTLVKSKNNFCVVGGGFIGSEISAALTKNNKQVTMIFPEAGISGARFPNDLAEFLNDYYREKGTTVLPGNMVKSIAKKEDQYLVQYQGLGSETVSEATFDGVIVGIGIKPNIDLAGDAGIILHDGIMVNEYLQTNQTDIFAAGDVTNFYHLGLGKRVRVEHEDNANKMGMAAGLNMSGEMEKYDNFPFFYSDLFDLGYEALGELNKDYEIYSDWINPYKKGTLFYLKQNKIRGLVFWNLWGKVEKGQEVISKGMTFNKDDLAGFFTEK
jgi:3-phenylpropionate/trans-cinnamate dioxygenase ferredoxin reductase component